ncbi:2-dehydropantoate 2-reductase N-terminal domain-containing protein [Microbulbifer sp. ANSA001]
MGAGALDSYCGVYLLQAGHKVLFVARGSNCVLLGSVV